MTNFYYASSQINWTCPKVKLKLNSSSHWLPALKVTNTDWLAVNLKGL